MTKRQNPFDDFQCQLKTHVGDKEVYMGVNSHLHMPQVYAKTLGMLFDGQRRMNSRIPKPVMMRDTAPSPERPDEPMESTASLNNEDIPEWARGQCTIDASGNLSHSQPVIHHMDPKPHTSCQCCPSQSQTIGTRCSFCERYLCRNCYRECAECTGVFCPNCSVMNYDESWERCYCLNCSTT